jgi:hypothetical protein
VDCGNPLRIWSSDFSGVFALDAHDEIAWTIVGVIADERLTVSWMTAAPWRFRPSASLVPTPTRVAKHSRQFAPRMYAVARVR